MPKETARGAGAAKKSADLSARQKGRASTEKISTRGGVRPAVVASGDMMTLRPVGATIGPADLARRAARRREGMFPGRYSKIFGLGERLGCILNLSHSFDATEAYL